MKAALEEADVLGDLDDTQGSAAEYLHIPLEGRGSLVAAIFLRSQTVDPIDSNDATSVRWESKGYWNGNQVFYGGDFINRLYAIEDAARAIGVVAAESTKKNEKKASQQIMAWLEQMDAANDDGPEGKPCVWPDSEGEMMAHEVPGNELDEEIPPGYHRCPGGIAKDGECPHCDSVAAEEPAVVPPAGLAGEGSVSGDGETAVQPPADQPTPDAVRQFEQRIAALSRELVEAVLERVSLENRLKTAKSREKEIIGEIQSASARGPERLPLFDSTARDNPSPPQAEASGSESDQSADQMAGITSDTDTAWRTAPLTDLGLPPKLTERLNEAGISTVGQLEDKRAEFNGLRSIEGIGPVKVDLITNVVTDWLTANRDRKTFEQAGEQAAEQAAETNDGQ